MQTGEVVPIPVQIYPAYEGIEEELFRRVAMLGRIELLLPLHHYGVLLSTSRESLVEKSPLVENH